MNLKETQNELISIIIPSYNSGKFLGEAIESAVNQTYKNIEIIIVNDGSTDNTEEIAKQWQKRDKRIRYLKHKENKGLSAARNTGIRTSKGDFIALLDADDVWMKDKLEKQIEKIRKEADIVYSNAILINEKGKKLEDTLWKKVKTAPYAGRDCLESLFQKNFMIPASSLIFKKEVIKEIGGFDEKLKSAEDYDFCLRALAHGYNINYVGSPLLFYQLSQQQMSGKETKMEFWRVYVLLKFIFIRPLFLLKHPFLVTKRMIVRIVALIAKTLRLYHARL